MSSLSDKVAARLSSFRRSGYDEDYEISVEFDSDQEMRDYDVTEKSLQEYKAEVEADAGGAAWEVYEVQGIPILPRGSETDLPTIFSVIELVKDLGYGAVEVGLDLELSPDAIARTDVTSWDDYASYGFHVLSNKVDDAVFTLVEEHMNFASFGEEHVDPRLGGIAASDGMLYIFTRGE